MVSSRWIQGIENINFCTDLRKRVFCTELGGDEKEIQDNDDIYAFNVILSENDVVIGCGRLKFSDKGYTIDKLCVIKEYRGKSYGELLVRMLVRKAVTLGADTTYACVPLKYIRIFQNIGFIDLNNAINNHTDMIMYGDVKGHCS